MQSKHHKANRDGDKDLSFTDVLIGSGSDHEHQGPQNSRWNEVDIYKTDSGKYVVAERYIPRWQGEQGSDEAEVCISASEVLALLQWENEDGDSGLSDLAKEALVAAAENDSTFEGLTIEEV